jgi:hypothetical protein
MTYPNKKEEANNNPYHLTAKAPIRNISGFTSQGTISKCIVNRFTLSPKIENIIIDHNQNTKYRKGFNSISK